MPGVKPAMAQREIKFSRRWSMSCWLLPILVNVGGDTGLIWLDTPTATDMKKIVLGPTPMSIAIG